MSFAAIPSEASCSWPLAVALATVPSVMETFCASTVTRPAPVCSKVKTPEMVSPAMSRSAIALVLPTATLTWSLAPPTSSEAETEPLTPMLGALTATLSNPSAVALIAPAALIWNAIALSASARTSPPPSFSFAFVIVTLTFPLPASSSKSPLSSWPRMPSASPSPPKRANAPDEDAACTSRSRVSPATINSRVTRAWRVLYLKPTLPLSVSAVVPAIVAAPVA